jgi:hypothetical protein
MFQKTADIKIGETVWTHRLQLGQVTVIFTTASSRSILIAIPGLKYSFGTLSNGK